MCFGVLEVFGGLWRFFDVFGGWQFPLELQMTAWRLSWSTLRFKRGYFGDTCAAYLNMICHSRGTPTAPKHFRSG